MRTHLSYFFALSFMLCSFLGPSKAYAITLTKNRSVSVPKVGEYSLTYHLKKSVVLTVSVKEVRGKKIEFRVLQDGKIIYRSGVKRGEASGTVAAKKGTISILVVNNNFLRRKQVLINVSAQVVLSRKNFFRRSKYSQILDKNKRVTIGTKKSYVMTYSVRRPVKLFIKISEAFGKKIEFRVKQRGITLYDTGRVRGGAKTTVKVEKGKFKIIIKNGNWISSKTVDYFVAILR